jgi:MFS family permease
MIGAIGGQAPLAALVAATGWRPAMLWIGLSALVLAGAMWLIVRDRPRGAVAAHGAPSLAGVLVGLRAAATDGQLWVAAFAGCMMSTPVLVFAGLWGVPYLRAAHGLSAPSAALYASLMMVGWAVGGPAFGWLSDRTGHRRAPMIAGAIGLLATTLAAFYLPGLPLGGVALMLFLNGVMAGSMVLIFAVIRERSGAGQVGAAFGLVNMVIMGSGAVFQPLVGFLLDLNWDGAMAGGARVYGRAAYDLAFATLPAVALAGLAAMLLIRETRRPGRA